MPIFVKPTFGKSCITSEFTVKTALRSWKLKSVKSDNAIHRHEISPRGLKHLNTTNKIINILKKHTENFMSPRSGVMNNRYV